MSRPKQKGLSEESVGALAYLTAVPAVLLLVLPRSKKSAFLRLHAWQSIEINLGALLVIMALSFTSSIDPLVCLGLEWMTLLFTAAAWNWFGIRTLHGNNPMLPLLGTWTEKFVNRERKVTRSLVAAH
jgi:uncharacterized membrane protein